MEISAYDDCGWFQASTRLFASFQDGWEKPSLDKLRGHLGECAPCRLWVEEKIPKKQRDMLGIPLTDR